MQIKKQLKKIWRFIWYDDSLLSWFANLLLAFVIIKFVLYPFIGLVMGTPLPVVAVVSESMDHSPTNGVLCGKRVFTSYWDACGWWYEKQGITKEEFENFKFSNGFKKGDIMVIKGVDFEDINVGDVVVFTAKKPYPIIHRVIKINNDTLLTKGDHNEDVIIEYVLLSNNKAYYCYVDDEKIIPSPCVLGSKKVTGLTPGAVKVLDETKVLPDEIIGKAVFRIPYLGYVKILFAELLLLLGIRVS